MKTIQVFSKNQPCLDIVGEYGINRDRNPDSGWGQLRKTFIDYSEEVELTDKLRVILLEDLAYVYGENTEKFNQKLREFCFI